MTTATTWPPTPGPRIRHTWRCARRAPTIETVKDDALGRAHVVTMCQQCGGTDLIDRIRSEQEPTP